MAETKFQLCSRALTEVGCNPITSFEDGTAEAIAAGQHYEPTVLTALSSYRWRFATKQFLLNKLSALPLDAPSSRWQYQFKLPADLVQLNMVTRQGCDIEFDRYEQAIYTDENDDLIADYVYRVDETAFPSDFANALKVDLMAIFAGGLARNPDLAEKLRTRAKMIEWPNARRSDSQQQTARRLQPSRLVTVRRF